MRLHRDRVQSDRVVFNGHDLSELVSCKVHRPVMPPVEASFETVPGRHGEVFKRATRQGYDLPVEMWLRAQDRREVAELRHRLASALWTDEPVPLYLPDDPTRYLMAIVSGETDLGEITDECPAATVTFHVGDPDYYGQRRKVAVSAGTVRIDVGGNRPSCLTVTAHPGACSSWRISNLDTGEHVEVAQALTDTSTVVLDMATERATVNGHTARVTIDSDYFDISGRTRLQVSGGSAVLEWSERWL